MQGLKIDDKGNLVLSQNSLTKINGVEKAAQDVKTCLGLFKGENPFNTNEGVDWLNVQKNDESLKSIIRDRLKDNEEVVNVRSITIEKDKTERNINLEVNTIYGVVSV